ncbi:polycystin-1-like protein 2 isoform X6 [Apostichopus japonicus]|uniref:polycystin-1-like protein 2 isoform X6 n=1 Tax=Stichopus japonicus TaxID=307972 RepID=UPI003AB32EAF
MTCAYNCLQTLLLCFLFSPSFHILCSGTDDAVYVGCFEDSRESALSDANLSDPQMTHSRCFEFCRSSSSPYAGLQSFKYCYCGKDYDKYGELEESLCSASCSGNPEEVCGGRRVNSVYLLVYSLTVGEGHVLDIDCGGHYISIRSSNYGALPGDPGNLFYQQFRGICQSAMLLPVLQHVCHGKHDCNVSATNQVFGDPCIGVSKNLTVSYSCVKNPPEVISAAFSSDFTSTGKSHVTTQDFTSTEKSHVTTQGMLTTQETYSNNQGMLQPQEADSIIASTTQGMLTTQEADSIIASTTQGMLTTQEADSVIASTTQGGLATHQTKNYTTQDVATTDPGDETTQAEQRLILMYVDSPLVENLQDPVVVQIQWLFSEPVESFYVSISWGDGKSTNESVPADSSGDHSFGHNYDSCGCFKVAGEVTGDDHQLFYQEMDVCVMDKIMSIDINVQDENGRIMESGSSVGHNISVVLSASVTPSDTTCHTFSWDLLGPDNTKRSSSAELLSYHLSQCGTYTLTVLVQNEISVERKNFSIYVTSEMTVVCDSWSTVRVPVTCTLEMEGCKFDLRPEVDFGDGSTGVLVTMEGYSKKDAHYTYENIGKYNITVRIGNDVQATRMVTITAGSLCLLTSASIRDISFDASSPSIIPSRSSVVHLGSTIEMACSLEVLLVVQWELHVVSAGSVDEEVHILPATVLANQTDLIIPPMTLKVGNYRVLLRVSLQDEDGDTIRGEDAEGWMVVERSDLVAHIDGGSQRTVGQSSAVILDGSSSHDPDFGGSPQFDPGLVFSWSCLPGETAQSEYAIKEITCDGSTLSNRSVFVISKGSVDAPQTLVFQLKVEKGNRSAIARQKLVFVAGNLPQIAVRCIQNCGSYLMQSSNLVLQASCLNCLTSEGDDISYSWKIYRQEENAAGKRVRNFDWEENSSTGRNQEYLVIKGQALVELEAGMYYLEASGTRELETGRTEYSFGISTPPANGSCRVSPRNGTVLETRFTVLCEGYVDDDHQPISYSVYRTDFNGFDTLISSYKSASSPSFYLPLGNESNSFIVLLRVKVSDVYGCSTYSSLSVKVLPILALSGQTLGERLVNLTSTSTGMLGNLLTSGNREAANQMMVSMATILNDVSLKDDSDAIDINTRVQIRDTLIKSLSTMTVQSSQDVLQTSSSLSLLTEASQEISADTQMVQMVESSACQVRAVSVISSMISYMKQEGASNNDFSSQEAEPVVTILATGLSNVFEAALKDEGDNDTNTEHSTDYSQRDVVLSGIGTIDGLQDILVNNKVPGEKATAIKTSVFGLSVSRLSTDQVSDIQIGTTSLHGIGQFQLPDSKEFYHNLTRNQTDGTVDIQLIEMPTNPFLWGPESKSSPVTSGVMGLKLKSNQEEIKVPRLDESPFTIILKQPPQPPPEVFHVMAGSVVGLNITMSGTVAHDLVQITLVPSTSGIPVSGCIHGNASSDNGEDIDDNPCLATFSLPHQISDETTASMESLYTWTGEISLPEVEILHLEVKVGELPRPEDWHKSDLNLSVYSSSAGCVFWDENNETWSSRGCWPGPRSDPWYTHCLCNHLSFFGSSMLVRPNKIDLIADARLFLTFVDNPLVVSTVAAIFVGYLVVAIWAYRKDKMDTLKAQVTVLADNDPYDHYRYLVTVVTGWRRGASTTANVTLTLHGTKYDSEPHILRNSLHPVLEAGAHDTFLLTTRGSLGEVTSVRLWHDNAGAQPEWYLSRIIIHDQEMDSHFLFICNCWLASTIDDGRIDRTFHVATPEHLTRLSSLLSFKATDDFQDGHLWFSVLSRPPRSSFTRLQRVSCCFSLLMTAMMTNIMFYGVPTSPGEQVLDFGAVRITIQEIIIGIEAAVIAFPINFVIVSIFRHARPSRQHHSSELYGVGQQVASTISTESSERNEDAERKEPTQSSDIYVWIDDYTESLISSASRCLLTSPEFLSTATTLDRSSAACKEDAARKMHPTYRSQSIIGDLDSNREHSQIKSFDDYSEDSKGLVGEYVCPDPIEGDSMSRDGLDEMGGSEEGHNRLLYSKLVRLVKELETIGPDCFSSEAEYQTALSEARALVLTALSVHTPVSSSYDTSISVDEDSVLDGTPGGKERWYSWLRRQPQRLTKKDAKKGIPHVFVYLGWLLLVVTCLASGYVTMLYGLKYGKQRSLDWLVSLFVSTLQSIFITQPIKIILFAVILSMIFRQWEVEDDGAVHLEEEVEEKELDNAEQLHRDLVRTKKDDVRYQPPPRSEVDSHRRLKDQEKNLYALLKEIGGYVMFIWLLLIITYSRRDKYAYYMTRNIRNRYFDGNKLYNLNLTHYKGFFEWTENTLLPNLYSLSDYEGDTQSTLLGGVRIRQLRVRSDACDVLPVVQNTISDCGSRYTLQSKDTRGYNRSWHKSQSVTPEQGKLDPWTYREDISLPFKGKVTFYDEGGYVWYLGDTMDNAEGQVQQMKLSRWLDTNTRAIFVDWTVFNANINMFGVVTCLLETPAGGGMLKTFVIHSVRLYRSASNTSVFVTLCEAAFTLSLVYYMYRNYQQWKDQRVLYWRNSWNWLEVTIIVNALVMIALYITQLVFVKRLFQEFREQPGQFHDFRQGAMMENNLTYSSAFLVILSTIKFLHLLRLNPRMYLLTSVVFRSASEVLGFMFMIILLICTFSLFFTLYIGSQLMNYRSFVASFITLYNAIPGNFNVDEIRPVSKIFGPWATFVFQFASYFLFLDLLISALNENMTYIRRNPQPSKDAIMGLLLISKILSFFGIRKKVKT